jgi:hypothetical protein
VISIQTLRPRWTPLVFLTVAALVIRHLTERVLVTLTTGQTRIRTSTHESVDGYLWYQVETDASTGWVAGMYLLAA